LQQRVLPICTCSPHNRVPLQALQAASMATRLAALEAEARALGRPFNRPETRRRGGFKDADYDNAPSWDEDGKFVQPWVPQEPPPIPNPKAREEEGSEEQLLATKRFASWASRRSMYEFQKAEGRRARGEPPAYPRLLLDGKPYTEDDEEELDFWREEIKEAAERKAQGLVDPWDEPMNSSDEEHIPVCYGGRYKGPVGKIHPDGFLYVVEQEGAEDDDAAEQDEEQAEEENDWAKPPPKARTLTRRTTNPQPRRARASSAGAQPRSGGSRASVSSASSRPCRQSTCSGGQSQMPGSPQAVAPQPGTPPVAQPRKGKQAGRKTRQPEPASPPREDPNTAASPAPPERGSSASPGPQAKVGLATPPGSKSPADWLSQMLERTAMRQPADLAASPTACRSRAQQSPPDGAFAPSTPPASPPPKKPKNAYQLFVAEEKMTSVRRNSLASLADPLDEPSLRRISFAALWKELPPAVRKSYEEQAAELKHEFLAKRTAHEAAAKHRCQPEIAEPSPGKGSKDFRTPKKAPLLQTPEKAEAAPDQVSDHPLAKLLRSPRLQLHEVSTLSEPVPDPASPPKKRRRESAAPSARKSRAKRASCAPDARMCQTSGPPPPSVVMRRLSVKSPPWRIWRPKRRRIRFKSPPTAEWRACEAAGLSHPMGKGTATEEVSSATKNAAAGKRVASAQQAAEGKRKRCRKASKI